MTTATLDAPKPRLKLVGSGYVQAPVDKLATARQRFGRRFAHEPGGNWKEYPEPVLSRWSRRADYFNLDARHQRPAACVCYFKDAK